MQRRRDTLKEQKVTKPGRNVSTKESCHNDEESEDDAFKPKRVSTKSKTTPVSIPSQPVPKDSTVRKRTKKKLKSNDYTQLAHEKVDDPIDTSNLVVCKNKTSNTKAVTNTDTTIEIGKKPCKSGDNDSTIHTSGFCPICQVPLAVLKISAAMHTSSCTVQSESPACPDGSACLNSNMFHYRDFSHHELAAFRISEDYTEPDMIFTPQKAKSKHTPIKNSSGKKRPSKSPLVSSAKLPKRDGPSSSKHLVQESSDVLHEGNESEQTRKRLFSDDAIDMESTYHCEQNNLSPATKILNESKLCDETEVDRPQISESLDALVESELWCSDLILSGGTPQQDIIPDHGSYSVNIKSEPESQNTFEENDLLPSAASANVTIHYDKTLKENEQNLIRNQIECSESCKQSTESRNVMQANCSVLFKATGICREVAMTQSPLSVTFLINNSGWEALEIKGNSTTNVHKVEVSVCECSHSICVECSVNNSDVLADVKLNSLDGQEEKFFSTLGDLGLKKQQLPVQPFNNNSLEIKKMLLRNCNQITLSTVSENRNIPSHKASEGCDSPVTETEGNYPSVIPEEPGTVLDAFALLKKGGVPKRPATPQFSSGRKSGSSAPTPVPMVVSKATGSSWTLVAGSDAHGSAGGKSYNSVSKKVPAYKRIPDTPFVVDAFSYGLIPGAKIYFLSHFHSDHYIGLRKDFNFPIFCTQVTANLVHLKIRVDKQYLHVLKIGEPRVICGVEVEVYDANHCPGAVMILFRLLDGRNFLHVGDFRAHPSMEDNPQIRLVDKLYLDTTYCDPAYDFPYQDEVVDKVVQTVKSHLLKNKSTLIVCGTYTIGKEKVFMGIAEAFNLKIWTTGEKKKVLQCLEDKNILDRLTSDPFAAQIHVLPMRDIALQELAQHLTKYKSKYSHILGFKPTGWTTSTSIKGKPSDFQRSSRDKVTIYGVPYSEHSSFSELRRFVRYIRPKDIQVTVNVGKSAQYKKLFQQWLSSNRDNGGQSKVVQYFTSSSNSGVSSRELSNST